MPPHMIRQSTPTDPRVESTEGRKRFGSKTTHSFNTSTRDRDAKPGCCFAEACRLLGPRMRLACQAVKLQFDHVCRLPANDRQTQICRLKFADPTSPGSGTTRPNTLTPAGLDRALLSSH